jgi:hypothetical protein
LRPQRCGSAWTALRLGRRLLAAALLAVVVPGCLPARPTGTPTSGRSGEQPAGGWFREVAADSGLDFRWGHGGRSPLNIIETLGHGCAFFDYDRDGWMDAFLVGNDGCALFRNLGAANPGALPRFANVTRAAGLTTSGLLGGVAVGDYDNDGWPDLYVTGYGTCFLFRNTGRGRFDDVTRRAGVAALGPYDVVTAAAFADLDTDGRLDLFAGRYIRFTPQTIHFCEYHGVRAGCGVKNYDPAPPRVYRNTGGGVFRDATRAWGFDALHGRCLGVALAASERERGVALYAANDELPGDLMLPDGQRYRNAGVSSGTAYNREGLTQGGMGVDWGDYNNDGRPDLAVATFQNEPKTVYRNDGDDLFTEVSALLGVAGGTTAYVAWTAKFCDLDNDGWLDLFLTNGHSQDNVEQIERDRTYAQRMQLFRNEGGQLFRDVGAAAGAAFARPIVGRGAAFGDYDNDGRIDVLVVDEEGAVQLLHNEASTPGPPSAHWIGIRLEGRGGNRDAIGARVTVSAGERSWTRDLQFAGGYISSHDPRLHFGLGGAERLDQVVVRWPGGPVERLRDVPVDQYVRIREGSGRLERADDRAPG